MQAIVCGDSRHILPTIADESVDLIVTDPPYGISFMGKDWDKAVPSVDIWRECLRVLKPGAFAFVMSIPRMDCLSEMGKRLGEAGFEIGFTPIFWAYASGFPKAMNVGKAVDKRNARRAQEYQALAQYLASQREVNGLSQKDIAIHFPSKTGGLTGCVWNWENAMNVPTVEQWSILKSLLGLDDRFDELIGRTEAEREVIGKDRNRGAKGVYGIGGQEWDVKPIPATPEAAALDGSYAGFQPKPAVEVVIVAMKPLTHGTYIDQALDNGKGITWLDDGRIPFEQTDHEAYVEKRKSFEQSTVGKQAYNNPSYLESVTKCDNTIQQQGRFPANLLVSDDAVDDGVISKSGIGFKVSSGEGFCKTKYSGSQGLGDKTINTGVRAFGDSGGFSRYFSLDSWWGEKLKELPESVQRTFPFLVVPKAKKSEKNLGCENVERKGIPFKERQLAVCPICGCKTMKEAPGKQLTCGHGKIEYQSVKYKATGNPHPTVKPVKLMSYLVTLGSRPGDLVLDPFAGTCTTAMAGKMLGRDWLMIEISEEWCRIGRRRVDAIQPSLL